MHEAIISKFKKSMVFNVEDGDIDNLLAQHFGFSEYSVVAEEEQGNGCSLDYTLDGKLDKWELEAITEMLTTKRPKPFHTQALLNYLVSEGILEPGQYIIRISW